MFNNIFWIIFGLLVFGLLYLDLKVFNRKAHEIKLREACLYSAFWISISLIFNGFVWYYMGGEKAQLFLTSYIVEKALSVDNLFVFIVIFEYFNVDKRYQHRVLYFGILGALITRGIFIFAGTALLERFHFLIYVFGIYLVYIAYKLIASDGDPEPKGHTIVEYVKRFIPVSLNDQSSNFFVKENLVWHITPLFIVLIIIESTDIMFAFDSIPAVLSITTNSFIVYTSNIFAILGLRALYFVISDLKSMFTYLKYGLSAILGFIGIKMLISSWYDIPIFLSLSIVLGVLILSIGCSVIDKESW